MCLFGMRSNLGWLFLRIRRLRKSFFLQYLLLSYLKNLDKRPVPRIEPSPEIVYGLDGVVEIWDHSMSIVCAWPSKHLFTKHLLFHLHVNYLPPPWSLKLLPSTSSLVFSWRSYLRWGLWTFWWVTQFSCVSPMYTCYKNFVWFSPVNLSYVNLILRPARST